MLKRLKTFLKKKSEGMMGSTTAILLWLLLILIVTFIFMTTVYHAVSSSVRNALTDSNLAVSTISLKSFGETQDLLVCGKSNSMTTYTDDHSLTDEVYADYRDVLVVNMELDEAGPPMSKTNFVYGGAVTVDYFIIYNYHAEEDKYDVFTYNEAGFVSLTHETGQIFAPNGKRVYGTSIYSQISFPVRGYFARSDNEYNTYGDGITAHIGQLSAVTL